MCCNSCDTNIMELNLRLFFAIVSLRLNQMLIVNIIFYVIQLIISWSFDSSITESQNLCFIAYQWMDGWMRTSVRGRGRTSSLFPRDQPSPCPSKNQENFLHSLAAGSSRLVFYASSISILNQKKIHGYLCWSHILIDWGNNCQCQEAPAKSPGPKGP